MCFRPCVDFVQVNFFYDNALREFIYGLSRWERLFENGDGGRIEVVRELNLELDKQVTWFVMPLRWHTLAMYDLDFV
jgi:hypothetical protein